MLFNSQNSKENINMTSNCAKKLAKEISKTLKMSYDGNFRQRSSLNGIKIVRPMS